MKIVMVGTGYVGLVSGACFAELGNEVVCTDKNPSIIDGLHRGIIPIYEPGLEELVDRNKERGFLTFSTDIVRHVAMADIVFIAVGTPRGKEGGKPDLGYVFEAAEEIAAALTGETLVAMKSTVPVGTGRRIETIIRERNPSAKVHVASVPEFLREGAAVSDFLEPDRIVAGSNSNKAHEILRELHKPLLSGRLDRFIPTELETAELIKYAANAFLAVKISFINEVADLCEKVEADVEKVAHSMGLDSRIGRWGLSVGPGFGGSCFPKDTLALVHTAAENESAIRVVEAAIAANDARKATLVSRIRDALGGELRGKVIAVLGLTFKANTDDLRDSASIDLLPRLKEYGATVRAFDPQGMEEATKDIDGVVWCVDAYDAARDADCAVIMTEWQHFGPAELDCGRLRTSLRNPLLIDFRNLHDPEAVVKKGLDYISFGRMSRTVN